MGDTFADLGSWPSSRPSSRASKSSTPVGGASDSFADLAATLGVSRPKLAKMSLAERLQLKEQQKNESLGKQTTGDLWSGIDFLDGSGPRLPESVSKVPDEVSSPSTSAQQGGSLIDDFGLLDVADTNTGEHVSGDQSAAIPQVEANGADDNLDDLFDVFNKPPVPKTAEPAAAVADSIQGSLRTTPDASNHASRQSTPSVESRDGSQRGARLGVETSRSSTPSSVASRAVPLKDDPRDYAIAELVDMGFTAEQARHALRKTSDGLSLQEAIDVLMRDAHGRSSDRSTGLATNRGPRESMTRSESPDIGALAQGLSAQFMTTAGTFWKQGRKAVAKAVEQYNTGRERDSSVPAWMKSAQRYEEMERRRHQPSQQSVSSEDVTREAQLLDGPRRSRAEDRPAREPGWQETADAPTMSRAEKFRMLSKSVKMHQQEEEEQQYVSPARRSAPKREDTVPGPAVQTVWPEVAQASKPAAKAAPPKPQQQRKDANSKPKLVREKIDISPTALRIANASRQSGTEAFKRGDFSEASDHYTRALENVPPQHLLRTVILTNRAVCHIKVGDNKSALTDSEEVISIIGPTLGVGEEYEPGKSLRDIWIKAVTRKAEAFEHMEKFGDALEAYSTLMNNGASSTLVIEGRRRCAAALEPKPAIKPKATPSRPLSSASNGPISAAGKSALQRVKDEHKRVEAAETEKFALQESVDARINGWRHGNETNLRALLASLDNVLWPELGWKKASMADLVIPKKVKIIYMKAVAKTHPDKVPASATTEQKMIAEGVFVTLNKAWDDFKQSNGLA